MVCYYDTFEWMLLKIAVSQYQIVWVCCGKPTLIIKHCYAVCVSVFVCLHSMFMKWKQFRGKPAIFLHPHNSFCFALALSNSLYLCPAFLFCFRLLIYYSFSCFLSLIFIFKKKPFKLIHNFLNLYCDFAAVCWYRILSCVWCVCMFWGVCVFLCLSAFDTFPSESKLKWFATI